MSKKSKRQVSRQYARPLPVAQQVARSAEFNPDYTNIKHELRRIGIIAASFFAVLIVLSLFQNQLIALFIK
jgi:hypothetical protein